MMLLTRLMLLLEPQHRLACTVSKGHWRCFSFFFWLRVLDKAEYSAFESTLNSIVSYRLVALFIEHCSSNNRPYPENNNKWDAARK